MGGGGGVGVGGYHVNVISNTILYGFRGMPKAQPPLLNPPCIINRQCPLRNQMQQSGQMGKNIQR